MGLHVRLAELRTQRLLASGEPDDVVGVWVVRAASENGEDSSETLCARLGCAKHIQVALTWRAKVGGAVHIDVEVKSSPWIG